MRRVNQDCIAKIRRQITKNIIEEDEMTIKKWIVSVLLVAGQQVMAAEFKASDHVHPCAEWSQMAPDYKKLELHTKYGKSPMPTKIIIGHTVSEHENPLERVQTIQKDHRSTWAEVGYHFMLSVCGECYEGRDLCHVPCILQGHNAGSCAVGVIGRFHDCVDASPITEQTVWYWGKHLGLIAFKLNFSQLVKKENVFLMSELSERFPKSPGIHFIDNYDEILRIANEELAALRAENK